MRPELFYKPHLLLERLADKARKRARLAKLRNTCAAGLQMGHIDSLELLELVRENGIECIYDIGANVGTWTLLSKALFPHAMVEAFEPYSPHLDKLRKTVQNLSDVRVHSVALGSENNRMTLRVTSFSDASSMLPAANPGAWGLAESSQVQVPGWRLDDYRTKHNLPLPDLVKLDVQGFELEVLKGATSCLRHTRVVIAEVSFVQIYVGQCLFHDVVTYLAKQNLFLTAFGVNTPTGRAAEQTDVLFTRQVNARQVMQ